MNDLLLFIIKKLFFIFIFSGLLPVSSERLGINLIIAQKANNLNQYSPYKMIDVNKWITFDSITTKEFSESFKKKLSETLSVKLHDMLGNKVSGTVLDFHLTIGAPVYQTDENNKLISKPFEIKVHDNYVFVSAGLSTVFAQLYYVSIAWSSPEFENPQQIHKSDITNRQVDFYWCDDFPTEEIMTSHRPTKSRTKSESGYKFDVEYYLKVFPDVTIYFEFKDVPSNQTLDEIQSESIKFRDKFKTVFLHEMIKHQGYYTISINHNTINYDTYTEKDFEQDVDNLDFFLKNLNSNPKITGLTQVIFQ